ncbi:UNKNOWN [Stylonychia lemnae]|uniref:Uncharacterized protein n=1 Tax=Stylonychia lemnae TaxID=5949 RepID=A0A078ARY8_STYLE|nr:UNKNOWN [Stylonychia lemnae]|eukprot:CDW83962.1 UNKNOWN [Stylonychia lemnae]
MEQTLQNINNVFVFMNSKLISKHINEDFHRSESVYGDQVIRNEKQKLSSTGPQNGISRNAVKHYLNSFTHTKQRPQSQMLNSRLKASKLSIIKQLPNQNQQSSSNMNLFNQQNPKPEYFIPIQQLNKQSPAQNQQQPAVHTHLINNQQFQLSQYQIQQMQKQMQFIQNQAQEYVTMAKRLQTRQSGMRNSLLQSQKQQRNHSNQQYSHQQQSLPILDGSPNQKLIWSRADTIQPEARTTNVSFYNTMDRREISPFQRKRTSISGSHSRATSPQRTHNNNKKETFLNKKEQKKDALD